MSHNPPATNNNPATTPTETVTLETRLSLYELAEMDSAESARQRLLSETSADRTTLQELINLQTNNDLNHRLEELGTREAEQELVQEEFNREFESAVNLLLNSKDSPQRFALAFRQLKSITAGQLARIEVQAHNDAHIAILSNAITSNALVQAILRKLPTEQQEQINRAVQEQSPRLSQMIDQYLGPIGANATTISIIATTSQNEAQSTIDQILRMIENLPGGQAIGTILTNLRATQLSSFYETAQTQLQISSPRIFLDTMHQTIGEFRTIHTQIQNANFNSQNQDPVISDYQKLGRFILDRNFENQLLQSFRRQFQETSDLPAQQIQEILSQVTVDSLTVPVALAFAFGNEDLQYNWLTRAAGVFAYTRNIAKTAFSDAREYRTRRRRISARFNGVTEAMTGERHLHQTQLTQDLFNRNLNYQQLSIAINSDGGPLDQFQSSVNQIETDIRGLNPEHRQALTQDFTARNQRINSNIQNITPEDLDFYRNNFPLVRDANNNPVNLRALSDDELKTRIIDPTFTNSIQQRNLNAVNEHSLLYRHQDLADDFNQTVRNWETQYTQESNRLVAQAEEMDGILSRINSNPSQITDADLTFFRQLGSVTDASGQTTLLASLDDNTLRNKLTDNDFINSCKRTLTTNIEQFAANSRQVHSRLNQIGQRLNDTGQQINIRYRTRINGAETDIARVSGDVSTLTTHGRIMRGGRIAMMAGMAGGASVYDVTQGRSNVETAAIQVAQNGLYFIPVVGTATNVYELVRGETLAGVKLEGGDWWAAAGFAALGAASDVLTLAGGIGVGTRAALVSARLGSNAARGARIARLLSNAAELATAEGRIVRAARNANNLSDSSNSTRNAFRAAGTNFDNVASGVDNFSTAARARRLNLSNRALASQNWFSRGLLNFGAKISPLTTAVAVAGDVASNVMSAGRNLGQGVYHFSGFLYHKLGSVLYKIARVDANEVGNVATLLQTRNLDEAARTAALAGMDDAARLTATTTLQAAESGNILQRTANAAGDITNSRTARVIQRTEQVALVGTVGAVAVSLISQGRIDPIEVVATTAEYTGTAIAGAADAASTGFEWVTEADHYQTSYEELIAMHSQQYTDQQAFLESIGDPRENVDAVIDNWHLPGVRRLAAEYGMDINQLTEQYNQRHTGQEALEDHTVQEGATATI